ncbi:MAG: hypothetical protein AAFV96_16495, partial [Pseudomonadota bacterium]
MPADSSLSDTARFSVRPIDFDPTRTAALARLDAFAPFTGGHYKSRRNYDNGPDKRDNVSVLAP